MSSRKYFIAFKEEDRPRYYDFGPNIFLGKICIRDFSNFASVLEYDVFFDHIKEEYVIFKIGGGDLRTINISHLIDHLTDHIKMTYEISIISNLVKSFKSSNIVGFFTSKKDKYTKTFVEDAKRKSLVYAGISDFGSM